MNTRHFVLAALAYAVIVMVIATVWHLALFKDVYAAARMREHPLFYLGIASMLIQAVIVAYCFPRLSAKERSSSSSTRSLASSSGSSMGGRRRLPSHATARAYRNWLGRADPAVPATRPAVTQRVGAHARAGCVLAPWLRPARQLFVSA